MKKNVPIRPASVSDSPAICLLLQQLGYQQTPQALAEKIATNTKERLAFVAELDGRIVGFMSLHVIDWFHRSDAAARLSAVVVDDGYRRRGIGRALVEFAEITASRVGCSYIELTSNLRRKAEGTYDFYASLGYHAAQDHTNYFRKTLSNLSP